MMTENTIQAATDIIAGLRKDDFLEFTSWWTDLDAHGVHTDIKSKMQSPAELFELCCAWIQRKLFPIAADIADDEAAAVTVLDLIEARAAEWYERPKKRLRTAARAGEVHRIDFKRLAEPTLQGYRNAFTFNETGNAYLMPVKMDGLKFEEGKLFFTGEQIREVSLAELQDLRTKEIIKDIDTTTLLFYYTLMTKHWEQLYDVKAKGGAVTFNPILRFYLPDLAKARGLGASLSQKSIDAIKAEASKFHNVVGVMNEGYSVPSYYPVLNFEGYDSTDNTISLSSPYLRRVISEMWKKAVCLSKSGTPIKKRDGMPKLKAINTYAVHPDIYKEKSKAAVQNVLIIVQGVEAAGGNGYKIKASTLINKNPLFKEQLDSSSNKWQLLKRVFTKTWELLRSKTDLPTIYADIVLPDPGDPANVPTVKSLQEFVIRITHNGKKRG